jgi:hypothetical protein
MTPDELAARCRKLAPHGLRSVILYGSSVTGDFVPGKSDYNVLLIFERLSLAELRLLAPLARDWTRAGNRAPLLFTREELLDSADAFPLEFLDIQDAHRVLFGEPVPPDLQIKHDALRHELERELKGRLFHLRECYTLAAGRRARVIGLMVDSLSSFLVLFHAALRLYQSPVPTSKFEALATLARHIDFDPKPFQQVHELKLGRRGDRGVVANDLFAAYLDSIVRIITAVDQKLHSSTKGVESS